MNLLQNTTNDHENVLSEISANRPNINSFQDNTTDDELVIQRQPTTPQQPSQLTHDTAETVQDILTFPPNTSITTDSNAIQIPTRNITEHGDHIFNQENPSTLSVTNTIDTQPPQTHHNEIMIHRLLHLMILPIVLLIIHLNRVFPIPFPSDNTPYMKLSFTQILHPYNLIKHYNTFLLNHPYHPILLLY